MRCIALAQELKLQGFDIIFVARHLFAQMELNLANNGISCKMIESDDLLADAKETIAIAKSFEVEWVVLDGYRFVDTYQKEIKGAGYKLLCIDDIAETKYVTDIVVNQNPWVDVSDYQHDGSKMLLGTKYALVRNEFLHLSPGEKNGDIRKVLVNLGAGMATAEGIIALVSAIDQAIEEKIEIDVLTGMNGMLMDNLEKMKSRSKHKIRFIGADKFSPEIERNADMAISAAGSTLWELAYFKVPTLTVVIAQNQLPIAESLDQKKCCVNMGWLDQLNTDGMVEMIKRIYKDKIFRHQLADNFGNLVDGEGRKRVVSEMREMSE